MKHKKVEIITKIEIINLWNRFDITWNVNTDVNVLAGINGSGKSTIFDLIVGLLFGHSNETNPELIDSIRITFDNDNSKTISYEYVISSLKKLERRAKTEFKIKNFINHLKEERSREYIYKNKITTEIFDYSSLEKGIDTIHESLNFDIISTFDNLLDENSELMFKKNKNKITDLDKIINDLEKDYFVYQLNIAEKIEQALKINNNAILEKIYKSKNIFIQTISKFFKPSDKQIDKNSKEISFINWEGKKLLPSHLSSGEKQLLIILLKALVLDDKPAILFMDEPEISLHIDWQIELIGKIRELNPNLQIFIATHSPAIITEGWFDKVAEISDITIKDKKNETL